MLRKTLVPALGALLIYSVQIGHAHPGHNEHWRYPVNGLVMEGSAVVREEKDQLQAGDKAILTMRLLDPARDPQDPIARFERAEGELRFKGEVLQVTTVRYEDPSSLYMEHVFEQSGQHDFTARYWDGTTLLAEGTFPIQVYAKPMPTWQKFLPVVLLLGILIFLWRKRKAWPTRLAHKPS